METRKNTLSRSFGGAASRALQQCPQGTGTDTGKCPRSQTSASSDSTSSLAGSKRARSSGKSSILLHTSTSPRRTELALRSIPLQPPPLTLLKTFSHLSFAAKYAESVVLRYCEWSEEERRTVTAIQTPRVHPRLVDVSETSNTSDMSNMAKYPADAVHIVADVDDTVVISDDAFGDDKAVPLAPVVVLLRRLAKHPVYGPRVHIHFVTARLHDPEDPSNKDWTTQQLEIIRAPPHKTLHLAPAESRKSRVAISQWKFQVRERIAREAGAPIVLTIGDQASDLFPIARDTDFEAFDSLMDSKRMPFGIVQPGDGVTLWGLKLRARY